MNQSIEKGGKGMDIIQLVGKDPQVKEWISNLEEKMPRQLITGLAGSAKTLLFARAFKKTNKNMIILMPNLYYAKSVSRRSATCDSAGSDPFISSG